MKCALVGKEPVEVLTSRALDVDIHAIARSEWLSVSSFNANPFLRLEQTSRRDATSHRHG